MGISINQGQVQQLQLKAKAEKAKEAEGKEETSGKVNTQAGGYEPVTASAADAMAAMNMMLVEDGKVKGDNNNNNGNGACFANYNSQAEATAAARKHKAEVGQTFIENGVEYVITNIEYDSKSGRFLSISGTPKDMME